jgi:hypothetical protein
MARSFTNKLNAIQTQRAPQFVSDESLQETIESMADAGTFPKGLIAYTQRKFETEDYVAVFGFDAQKQEWVLKRTDKSDGSVLNLRGSRQDISDGLAFEKALLQRAVNEAIEEAELTDPDYMTGDRLECFKWTTETPHGREYKTIAYQRVWLMLQARLAQLGHLPITVANLERAYCDLLDMIPCPLDHFFAKRDARLAQKTREVEIAQAEATPARTPFENLRPSAEVEARLKADAENRKIAKGTSGSTAVVTKQGLAKLRRLATDSRYAHEHRQHQQ